MTSSFARIVALSGLALCAALAAAADGSSSAARLRTGLLKVGRSPRFAYAASTGFRDWSGDGLERFRREFGVSPRLYFVEFRDICGTWYTPETYAANRTNLAALVKREWAAHRAVPMVTWHLNNPYMPPKWRNPKWDAGAAYRYRYGMEGYPEAHRWVLREIVDGTGEPCGNGRIDGPGERTFPNPRAWYEWCLKEAAAFCRTLKDGKGRPIPIVFRPFHECESDWFWWGSKSATCEDYSAAFRLTVDILRRELGAENVLFAYSPDRFWSEAGEEGKSGFLARYPGDAYCDMIGFDDYDLGKDWDSPKEPKSASKSTQAVIRRAKIVSQIGRARGKICGLFECGALDSVDSFYAELFKVMTAPGVEFALAATYDGPWTWPRTEAGLEDMAAFFKRPEVIADRSRSLYEEFIDPPADVKVGCYYYWVNGRVDEEGVKKDLLWMKTNGITRAFLATDIRNKPHIPIPGEKSGDNVFMGERWWRNLRTALKTAGELGIEMGIFNGPGWSQSGGPWIKPEEAMRNYNPTNSTGWEISCKRPGVPATNAPCSPEATGWEVDKLSARHVRKHFDSFMGEILRRIPKKDRPTLTTLVVDSWECGWQNYTDDIFERFKARYGRDLDYSDKTCIADLDRLVAGLVASEYMGTLTKCAHENGLITWCEPYAHSPVHIPIGIDYGSAADEVSAEFWVNYDAQYDMEVNSAVRAAKAGGKNKVYAESFTCGDWHRRSCADEWSFGYLKPLADRYFHKGVNATILHVVISQPGDDSEPPVRPWFGTYFDRRSRHASELKRLVEYCRRCNYMLQLGRQHDGQPDERILEDGTIIRFTPDSCFEIVWPSGKVESWDPATGKRSRRKST